LKKFTKPWKPPPKKKERKERQEKETFFKRKETLTPIHPATYLHTCRALRLRDKIDGAQWTRMEVKFGKNE
jgi:hypothetical protein